MNANEALTAIAKLANGTMEITSTLGPGMQYVFKTEAIASRALELAYANQLNVQGGSPKSFIIWAV